MKNFHSYSITEEAANAAVSILPVIPVTNKGRSYIPLWQGGGKVEDF